MDKRELAGIAAGIASSTLGGMATAVTRLAVATQDPVLITMFRFGIGSLLLFVAAIVTRVRWPAGRDLAATALLGMSFYGVFFVVFASALTFTTAARGALGIATLPALTMAVAAALGRERLTARKCAGVLVALIGVAMSLASGLRAAPAGAWRGDLTMISAMLSMSLYTIYSRPVMARSSALGYTCTGMAAGAAFEPRRGILRGRLGHRSGDESAAVGRRAIPRNLSWGRGLLSMDLRRRAHDADASRKHDHHESDLGGLPGIAVGARAIRRRPAHRRGRGGRRNLDRLHRRPHVTLNRRP